MNYRHAYHAGNFADVLKHAVLARIIEYLKRKESAFRIHDTHAGRGIYDLSSVEAGKTGEWIGGIARLLKAELPEQAKDLLLPYFDTVDARNEAISQYPGSPLIVRRLLRKQDRLSLCELHPEDFTALSELFAGDWQVRVNKLDGWLLPGAHLPPKEKRGLVLIDPPFEQDGDFSRILDALAKTHARWPGGTVMAWYPIKDENAVQRFVRTLRESGIADLLRTELRIGAGQTDKGLCACGLIIKNPPYILQGELDVLLPALTRILARDAHAKYSLERLTGE